MSTRRYCTFQVGGLLLGVDVELVQEVLGDEPTTHVPLADPCVCGLLNLRGEIVTAIDARQRLGIAPRHQGERRTNIVVRMAEESVSLVVDAEGEVIDVLEADFEPLPETVGERIRSFVTGACKVDDELLLVLDAELMLTVGSE